jgi:hypothetical protein
MLILSPSIYFSPIYIPHPLDIRRGPPCFFIFIPPGGIYFLKMCYIAATGVRRSFHI